MLEFFERLLSFLLVGKRSLAKDSYAVGGLLSFIFPISIAFVIVLVLHLVPKFGVDIPPILLEPLFNLWFVFVAVLISICAYMRQFFILFMTTIISFIVTVIIWAMYVLETV